MCGLWGFEGKPNVNDLREIIRRADERGGHGYGFFGITKEGKHVYHVSHGRVNVDLLVTLAKGCVIGVGHSRLITGGDYQILNSQPVVGDGIVLVHNGNIENHREIMRHYGYEPRTSLDSEALIPLIENEMDHICLDAAFIAIKFTKYENQLIIYAKSLPLVSHTTQGTKYYCSKEWKNVPY